MCSEGGCCGPCCSTRSWLITHVVFVMLGAGQMALLSGSSSSSSSSSSSYSSSSSNSYSNSYSSNSSNGDDLELILQIVQGIAFLERSVWSTFGWVLICNSSKGVHIAYVVFCGIDLVLNICQIIVSVLVDGDQLGVIMLLGPTIIIIAIIDIAPMLCFCICQEKTLSKYSDGVHPNRPTGQGVVYAAGPQTIQVYPNPNAGCPGNPNHNWGYPGNPNPNAGYPGNPHHNAGYHGNPNTNAGNPGNPHHNAEYPDNPNPNAAYPGNPDHNAAYPHGSDGPPAYTEVQKV